MNGGNGGSVGNNGGVESNGGIADIHGGDIIAIGGIRFNGDGDDFNNDGDDELNNGGGDSDNDGGVNFVGGVAVPDSRGADIATGVDVYLLAGIKTWPSYFREPAEKLRRMGIEAGYSEVEVHVLYPYGDHTSPLLRQVRQVTRDVMRRLALAADDLLFSADPPGSDRGRGVRLAPLAAAPPRHADISALPHNAHNARNKQNAHNAHRGQHAAAPPAGSAKARLERLVDAIRGRSAGRVVVLIGHSGGGVAAYHAGRRLLAEGAVRDCRIVQIGSPKVRIHPALRNRTAFFYAADEHGRVRDPITRLGTWGGIRRAAAGVPVWDPRRWAPGHVAAIMIDGGHKDYFSCDRPVGQGRITNLDRTAEAVLNWLVRSLRPARPEPSRTPEPARPSSQARQAAPPGQPALP